MKVRFLFLIGVILCLVSCQTQDLDSKMDLVQNEDQILPNAVHSFNDYTAPEVVPRSSRKSSENRVTRDIVFKYSKGTFSIVPNPDACSSFFDPPLQFVVEGDGIATHIGRFTVKNYACINTDGEIISNMYGFITAANGDVIHTMVVDNYPDEDNPPYVYYEYEVIGGSEEGRFENATGHITMYGILDYGAQTFDLTGWGEITY